MASFRKRVDNLELQPLKFGAVLENLHQNIDAFVSQWLHNAAADETFVRQASTRETKPSHAGTPEAT